MKAVIPCAKKKESLFPFTESKPTGLLPVGGRPLVRHLINKLQSVGVQDIYIVTNYMESEFEEEFREYTNVNTINQEKLEGTAAAVQECSFIDEDFLVINGDVAVSESDLQGLIEKHQNSDPEMTLLAAGEQNAEKFGVLSIRNDKVTGIDEKPENAENNLVNTGIYALKPRIFDIIEKEETGDLTDAVQNLEDKRFELVQDYWVDIGSLRKLHEVDKIYRKETSSQVSDNARVHPSAVVENSRVEKNASIKQNAVVKDSIIGENAVVGSASVVKDSTVNPDSSVRNADVRDSLLFEKTEIDPNVSIDRSVLGEDSTVLSGTAVSESFIGPRSFIEVNNSIRGVKFVPDARTDLSEISK